MAEGPIASRSLGRLRLFRYEARRWRDGVIPDIDEAVESPRRVSTDVQAARRSLARVPAVPTAVWGRDDLGAGEMWNSNSLISWLLVGSGIDAERIPLPAHGRAPGWTAGMSSPAVSGHSATNAESIARPRDQYGKLSPCGVIP